MLGYTWVVFEKFSVLFSRDGYLFSTTFLYFFHEMGTFFQDTSCIFVQGGYFLVGILLVCFPKSGGRLRTIFLYFPARWVSFKRIFLYFGFKVGGFPVSHISLAITVLSHFLAHVPISEHASLLKYRRTEVNRNIAYII